MIFQETMDGVLGGSKTETRRLWQPGWELALLGDGDAAVRMSKYPYRTLYQTGRTYAAQLGRGQKGVCRVLVTEIRREFLQDITEEDAVLEGFEAYTEYETIPGETHLMHPSRDVSAREAFLSVWNQIHRRRGTRAADNPEVVVITFQLAKEVEG